MFKKKAELVITALIIFTMIGGIILTYYVTPNYDAHLSKDADGDLAYTVSTNSATTYTIFAFDNARPVDKLYIYYDERYAVYEVDRSWQERIISQTVAELRIRGLTDVEIVDANRLGDIVDGGYVGGEAILITSGILPDTVYQGNVSDGIFKWVSDGGSLYWIGYAIGAKYAEGNDVIDVAPYQENLFGVSDCILTDEQMRSAERSSDPLSNALMLSYDDVTFGLNVDKIPGALSIGFEHEFGGDTYGSITLVGRGSGMICVMGVLDIRARTSMSQIISSGVSDRSELIAGSMISGPMVRSTSSGTIELSVLTGKTDIAVHIRMGEPNIVYARTFFFGGVWTP